MSDIRFTSPVFSADLPAQADVVIIGAGAAGLMCAIEAGKRGRKTVILDHAKKIAEKIRIAGGGRCNFTNIHCDPTYFLSQNPHFCRSALSRYTAADFIDLVKRHAIPFHEKTLGQLFCDRSSMDIITMLLEECAAAGILIVADTSVQQIEHSATATGTTDHAFALHTSRGPIATSSLVIATGGPAIPKIGATGFGYAIARQFGIPVIPDRAGLVPLVFDGELLDHSKALSGVAIDPARATSASGKSFDEAMLFTHRGLSGPVILQLSSYWQEGEAITVNLAPHLAPSGGVTAWLKQQRNTQPRSMIQNILAAILPKRLAQTLAEETGTADKRIADASDKVLAALATRIEAWRVIPSGSEGYRTAEVALGGVDTRALSSQTFECRDIKNLYFIGEVVDVTGHLGGFNFQWAWSSGWCAGQVV